jgi:hypothetical protein
MILADVVFPVFTAPYVMGLFMPWILVPALMAEVLIFKAFYLKDSWGTLIATILGANASSWLLGILLGTFLLPSGIREHGNSIDFAPGLIEWAFLLAFVLSVIIESWVWWAARTVPRSRRVLIATLVANVGSYGILIGGIKLMTG